MTGRRQIDLDNLASKIGSIEARLTQIEQRLLAVERRAAQNDQRIDNIEAALGDKQT